MAPLACTAVVPHQEEDPVLTATREPQPLIVLMQQSHGACLGTCCLFVVLNCQHVNSCLHSPKNHRLQFVPLGFYKRCRCDRLLCSSAPKPNVQLQLPVRDSLTVSSLFLLLLLLFPTCRTCLQLCFASRLNLYDCLCVCLD